MESLSALSANKEEPDVREYNIESSALLSKKFLGVDCYSDHPAWSGGDVDAALFARALHLLLRGDPHRHRFVHHREPLPGIVNGRDSSQSPEKILWGVRCGPRLQLHDSKW